MVRKNEAVAPFSGCCGSHQIEINETVRQQSRDAARVIKLSTTGLRDAGSAGGWRYHADHRRGIDAPTLYPGAIVHFGPRAGILRFVGTTRARRG